ncbi:hypothetical protein ACTA71_007868 [Dictyostelium dimigraforme]
MKLNDIKSPIRLFNFIIYQQPFKILLDCIQTLIFMKPLLEPYIKSIPEKKLFQSDFELEIGQSYQWLTMEQVNEIKYKLNDINLNQPIQNLNLQSLKLERNTIEKLYKMARYFKDFSFPSPDYYEEFETSHFVIIEKEFSFTDHYENKIKKLFKYCSIDEIKMLLLELTIEFVQLFNSNNKNQLYHSLLYIKLIKVSLRTKDKEFVSSIIKLNNLELVNEIHRNFFLRKGFKVDQFKIAFSFFGNSMYQVFNNLHGWKFTKTFIQFIQSPSSVSSSTSSTSSSLTLDEIKIK